MAVQVLTSQDYSGFVRILNLPPPASSTEPARLIDLNNAIEGLSWKDDARAATSTNVNISAPGASLGGVTAANGDIILLRGQTIVPENGLYIFNGAAAAMTRHPSASTFSELEGAVVTVTEGTDAGTSWRQTQVNGVIGTNDVIWTSFGTGAPSASETVAGIAEIGTQAEVDAGTSDTVFVTPLKLATSSWARRSLTQTIGDGSATLYTVTHNFGTRAVTIDVYRNSGNFDDILVEKRRPSINSVAIVFQVAPSANEFVVNVRL